MRTTRYRRAAYLTACAATVALVGSPALADVTVETPTTHAETSASVEEGTGPEMTTLRILGITDFHGHISRVVDKDKKTGQETVKEPGAVALACEVAKVRAEAPNALFLSAGDNVGGSAYDSSILKDEPTMTVLNQMSLDATAAGNHEFDGGITDLADHIIPNMNAPVLSANVTGDATLDAEGNGHGVYIKDVDGIKVGIVGVTTDELPTLTDQAGLTGLTIADATKTANERAGALKDGKDDNGEADVVVVIAHEDAAIYGGQFSGDVDAVIGGHTHVPYAEMVKTTAGNAIPVVQPDHYGLKLGDITLRITQDVHGKATVTAAEAKNIDLASSQCAAADATEPYGVAETVAKAQADAKKAGDEVLATLGSDFLRGTNDGQEYGSNRSTESTASNLIAQSFYEWVSTDIKPEADHYIGLMNPGGVRADYGKGELTKGEAFTVQPFGNEIAYATYTGAQIKQVFAEQFQPTTSRAALILGTSDNVRVTINQAAADELERIWDEIKNQGKDPAGYTDAIAAAKAKVIDEVRIDGQPLADEATVVAASNSFLLGGGDSFTTLKESPMTNTGILDRDITGKVLAGRTAEANTAKLVKHQIGREVTISADGRTMTVRLTGLAYSAASEQSGNDVTTNVVAALRMPTAGSEERLAEEKVDMTVTAGLPETGQATLTFTVPEGAATAPCSDDASTQCAVVGVFPVGAHGGRVDGFTYDVEFPVAGGAANPDDGTTTNVGTGSGSDTATGGSATQADGKGKATRLARTGADLALAIVAAGLLASGTVMLIRRRQASA